LAAQASMTGVLVALHRDTIPVEPGPESSPAGADLAANSRRVVCVSRS
jgi:hypothetical protein